MILGQVISGKFGEICIRQKSDAHIELGEILVSENKDSKILLQVYDLVYGSQISQQNLELISGLNLEENSDTELFEPNLRNYKLAMLKNLITIKNKGSKDNKDGEDNKEDIKERKNSINEARTAKILPDFFSSVREIKESDLSFLTTPINPLFLGHLRSGSKKLDVPISLQGDLALSHHILIPATTGKGKSNLLSVILWENTNKDYCSFLILDPHDEYYGRDKIGLKDHPSKNVVYYTPKDVPPGCFTLQFSIKQIMPHHFEGSAGFTMAQNDLVREYYKKYKETWIEAAVLEKQIGNQYHEATIAVVRRKLMQMLDLDVNNDKNNNELVCEGIFSNVVGETTINDILKCLENGKTVIADTSSFQGDVEILIGSLLASQIFDKYKEYKRKNQLKNKPVVSIVLEEAPRVLGKEVLENGPNIFSTIAREGRKFKIGLIAITQLPSLIPRTILANMNTKIILGIEMAPERQSIIESAAQDLSTDNRNIASLDKGEAIITSNFARFATPIKIPLFEEFVKKDLENKSWDKNGNRINSDKINLSLEGMG